MISSTSSASSSSSSNNKNNSSSLRRSQRLASVQQDREASGYQEASSSSGSESSESYELPTDSYHSSSESSTDSSSEASGCTSDSSASEFKRRRVTFLRKRAPSRASELLNRKKTAPKPVSSSFSSAAAASRFPGKSPRGKVAPVAPRAHFTRQSSGFKKACIELTRKIKAAAIEQLGLTCLVSDFNFTDYYIKNWPELVPYRFVNWDQQAFDDLQELLPVLKFELKPAHLRNLPNCETMKEYRRTLLDHLVRIFNEQTGLASSRVKWVEWNMVGWPADTNLDMSRLNCSEILTIWRNIDSIRFVALKEGETRYVKFTDGLVMYFDGPVPRRNEFIKMLKEAKAKSNVQPLDSDSEASEKEEIEVQEEEAKEEEEEEVSSYSDSSASDSDKSFRVKFAKLKKSRPKQTLKAASALIELASPKRGVKRSFSFSSSASQLSVASTQQPQEEEKKIGLAQSDPEFKAACIQLIRDIKNLIIEQLDLNCAKSDIVLSDYTIDNWPTFVPHHFKNWDLKAYNDLREAFPILQARAKPELPAIVLRSSINRRELLRSILDRLLERFNEQTGLNSSRIKWIESNIVGWPAGVNLAVDRLNRHEVLAVWRHIDSIQFLPLEPGQIRYVQFTDGTVIYFADKVPTRKEFAVLWESHRVSEEEAEETENSNIAANSSSSPNSSSSGSIPKSKDSKKSTKSSSSGGSGIGSTSSRGSGSGSSQSKPARRRVKRKNSSKDSNDQIIVDSAAATASSGSIAYEPEPEPELVLDLTGNVTPQINNNTSSPYSTPLFTKTFSTSSANWGMGAFINFNFNPNFDFDFEGLGFDFNEKKGGPFSL